MDFFTPSITVCPYSITGFTLVLMPRVSVFGPFLWGKVLQNSPVLHRPGHDRGPTQPARADQTGPTRGRSDKPGPNPAKPTRPPYLPPYLRQPAPIFAGAIDRGQPRPTKKTGANDQDKTTPPNQPNRGQQTTRKRAKQSTPGQSPQTANNFANGAHFEVSAN